MVEDDERTMELFESWSEFIVLIVLSVLCPPAALFRVQGSGFRVGQENGPLTTTGRLENASDAYCLAFGAKNASGNASEMRPQRRDGVMEACELRGR
jgi:hypothetical protein